jgi:hypothetical protein
MQRHLSWFIACTLLCGLGDAGAQNTDLNFSAQERLDAIRNSLVETALQGATQVRTTQWLDAQGQLRDASSFRSGMEVRGVQVLSYSRDNNGAAKAQLSRPHARQDLGRSLSDAAQAADGSCRQAESLRHVMGLTLVFEPGMSQVLQKQVREQIASQWLAAPDPAWRMVALSAATPVLSTGSQVSLYEQTLIGGHVKSMPWAATLRVSSQPLDGSTWDKLTGRNPRIELALSLTVQGTSGQNKEFQASHSLPLNANETGTASLQNLFSLWGERLGQWIGCDPLQPQVTQRKANLVHINAGGLAGVRAGDEWLLADPKTFPSQVVGPTSSALLLAKVVEVSAHQARLAILAGPAEAVQTHWRAWPAESLNR